MINIYSVIAGCETRSSNDALVAKFSTLKGHCRILLQVCHEYRKLFDFMNFGNLNQLWESSPSTHHSTIQSLKLKPLHLIVKAKSRLIWPNSSCLNNPFLVNDIIGIWIHNKNKWNRTSKPDGNNITKHQPYQVFPPLHNLCNTCTFMVIFSQLLSQILFIILGK